MTIPANINLNNTNDEKILKLKAFIEEMELQLTLEKADIIDELEKQKNSLITYINEQKEEIYNDQRKNELKKFFEELQVQLSSGKAENKEIFEENSKKINQKIDSIDKMLEIYGKEPDQGLDAFIEVFGYKIYKLRTAIEIAKLEYALGKADLTDEIELKKHEFAKTLNHFKLELENELKIVETNFEKLQSEIKSAFHNFFQKKD